MIGKTLSKSEWRKPKRIYYEGQWKLSLIQLWCLFSVVHGRYLEEEMKNLKEIMTNFQGKLEEFTTIHAQTLSAKVDEVMSRLEMLDKAMRALHERTVTWETTAQNIRNWEETLQTISNRVDLVVKRQEMLLTGEGSSNAPVSRRQLMDVVAARVNSIDSRLASAIKRQSDEAALNLRRHDASTERLIRLEGRASLLQDDQKQLLSYMEQSPDLQVNSVATTPSTALCEEKIAEKVLVNLLELFGRGESDENHENHNSRRSTKPHKPEELFKRVWRKFQNPVAKIGKKLDSLELLLLQASHLCNESFDVNTKIHNAVTRGECTQVVQQLQKLSIRTDNQIDQLEDKIGRQLGRLGKLLDRASRDGTLGSGITYPATCEHVLEKGYTTSGIYTIQPTYDDRFEAYCDLHTEGGGWMVIQRRGDFNHKRENFNRDWEGYRQGFGDPRKELWIGNDRLHELTYREDNVVRIELEDWENNHTYAEYLTFRVGPEDERYLLEVGNYSGNASDSFGAHDGKRFSTYDQIHDEAPLCCPCSRTYLGGWWFYSCFEAHLNGPYHANPTDNDYFQGIIWEHWRGDYSLRSAQVMIRPRHLHYQYTGRGGALPDDP